MGNKCCKNQSSTYSSANATIRSFSSYNSSILRSGGSHAITFGTSTRGGESLTTLTMKSSNHSDVGSKEYQGGSSSTVGQEDIIPIFLRRLNDLNIRVGTRTRLLIELDDATGVQVRWYHNNVEANNERYQYIHEGGFYCLDIVPVTLFDEGLWVCTAQNYAGKSSTAAHLSLIVPKAFKKPIFVEPLKAVLTQRGIVSLECKVIGVPTPKLRWYKDDKEIKAGDIFALTANSKEDCLGIYTCEAENVMGTALSTSKIQVTHTPLDGNHDADSLIPYGPPPKFVKFLKNASGKVGSVLFLECQVEVPPWPRSIGWYNDNGIVNEGPLYHLIADGLGMYGVEIKSLRADHSTTWKCVASSSTGAKAVTSCVVSVSYPKNYRVPRFLESLRAVMTDEGLVSFECKVIGYPTPQLLWFKDGKQLQPGDVYELTGSKSLGSYCCVARNCMGETSSLAELTIEDIQNQLNESEKLQLTSNTQPPRFLLGLKSIEANINESFVFMIKVTTESTASISWYKEDEELTESNRYQFSTEDNGVYILNIVSLEIDDQAEWKCVAINKYGQTATSSFLKLNIPKNFKSPRFLEELRIAFSNEGSVNLECKVIGVPQPQLKWFKDGQELNPGDMHKIISGQSGTCCLGTYTCQAHNCMGTVSSSATLLTMEDKSTVKSCASEEYLSVGNPLVRNESLSTIPEERTSQMEKSYTIEEPADISFSFDGKEVTVSLYETPDLTHDEALQIIEMYADELSEHISEDNVVDLPSLRIVKESSISGPVMMEALVIDVPIDFCRQQTVSDTEFDGVSLTEDITLENNEKSESICENSLEYFSDHLSSGNSKREVFYSASETTPKNSSVILKQKSEDDGHLSFQTPKLFMSDSDDQILTQLKLDERILATDSRHVVGPLSRSESNNTEEEVSETLAEIDNESQLSHNYCASEIATQSYQDGLYSTVLNKVHGKEMASMIHSSEEDDILKIISRPNVGEFLKYMKIILEGTMVKMRSHENFDFTSTMTELERSILALHSLAWKFIEETERNDVTELDKNTTDNVSNLMTAINASLLVLEQIDDPFGVSDNVLNEIQSSVCFDLETFNNNEIPATLILNRLSDQIKNFTLVVNRQVARVTEQRIIAVLRNTIGTTLEFIKTLQQNCSKIKCVDINSLAPLFSMVQPLETILNDIANMEEASIDDNKPNLKFKQILIPPISSIAFALDNLNKALKNDISVDDPDLKDIYDRIDGSTNQFMTLASHGMESNKIAECFISFTKPINDLCCHLRRLSRSTENIVSSDYGSDDKLLLDFETLFDELMIDIDTLINNVNFVQDSENNMNPLGSLLEPLQDMKIGLFQVNQVLLSNQTGSSMSFEVMSCFEHLSQQLVQLNNCIVNQSIVEESDKEIPFESSIKMMQNILFDDAIDDLGVNGILFGSVMKPLLQLQNLIVSKMASVESDLSFSEHTDVTSGACDTQSLSLSLSHNAQTIFDKTANENSKQVIIKSSIIDSSDRNCDKQNNLHRDTSEIEKDSIHFENNIYNNLAIKRGFECDIGETFKYDEPNIITFEDERENSGFEALFDETDLETSSDLVEDVCFNSIMNSNVDNKLSDLLMNGKYTETIYKKSDDIIPEHVLETLENTNQHDLILNTPVDLFEELQETFKDMSEVECGIKSDMYDLDNNKSNVNDLQNIDSTYINNICDKTNNLLEDSFDKNSYKEEQLFEIEQDVDFVDDLECVDTDKSISNNTIITVNESSDPSEVKLKEIDNKFNESEKTNIFKYKGYDTENKDIMLIKEVEVLSTTENDSDKSIAQDDTIVNEIDAIRNLGTNALIQIEQTKNENEYYIEEDKQIILTDKCTITTELDKELETSVEKTFINQENILMTENHNSSIIEEMSNKIKQCDDSDLLNKSISIDEESKTPANESTSSTVNINLIKVLKGNNNKVIIEEQNSGNENLSLVKSKYNDSDIFETNQDINLDNKFKHDLQSNINITSTTDYKQIVPNPTNCENLENPITELNVLKNEEPSCNNQQNPLIIQRSNILQQSNNEVNILGELKEQCESLSVMKTNNEIECISTDEVLATEINYPENEIDIRSVVQQCVIDKTNHIGNTSITQYNDENCVDFIFPDTDMTQTIGFNDILDKQLVVTNPNYEENENIAPTKFGNDVNNVESSAKSNLNEKETATDKKINIHSENKTTEIVVNDEEKTISTMKTSLTDLKQATILKNNDIALSENTLINNEVIITESTQLIDLCKFDENQVEIQFKENVDSRNEHNEVLDDKENMINNLEHLETKNEIIYFPDEMVIKDKDKLLSEVEYIQNDENKFINESANVVSEQTTALICNATISESNAQLLDTVVTDFKNIKENYEKELCVSKSNNLTVFENKIDTTEKNNQHNEDLERISKDKLIFKSLDEDNLICGGNKSEQFNTNDSIEIQISKSIDEKSNPVSIKDDIMQNNSDILKAMNNVDTDNVEEEILTELQLSNQKGVDVSSTENDSEVATDIDLKKTKINIEKADKIKTLASEINCLPLDNDQLVDLYDAENDLAIHSVLDEENTEDRNICSHPYTCIKILNQNNTNKHEEFIECQTFGNVKTLETLSHEKNPKVKTVNNEELLIINENDSEINKISEQTSLKNDIDKEQYKNIIDMCESLEKNKVMFNSNKQTISLSGTNLENGKEKHTEDSENNQENSEILFDYKNNLESTENVKNHKIKTEEIIKEFINLEDLETSKIKLETNIDQTPKTDYTECTKQTGNPTFEKLSNLVIDELNIPLENPQCECLSTNKDVGNTNIKNSNSNISVPEKLKIYAEVDNIDQIKDISKIITQDTIDDSNEKPKYVITKDYSDENLSCKSHLNLSEVRETQERKVINDDKEYEQSKINTDSINIKEGKLFDDLKINDKIDVVTALQNNDNPTNNFLFESEISDLPAEKSYGILSIVPILHFVEKIAINEAECMMSENTNTLKQGELDAGKNFNQQAQVEHELNTAVIGNIIMDYDSIKENSLNVGEENKFTEKETLSLSCGIHPFKIVSTNVDILNAPTKDSMVKEEQIMYSDTIEGTENSMSSIKLLGDNTNPTDKNDENNKTLSGDKVKTKLDKIEPEIVQDIVEIPDEKIENVISNIEENQKNKEIIGKDDGDKSTGKEKTKRGSKKNKSSTRLQDKKSPSPETTETNVYVNQINDDTTLVVDKSSEENNKTLSGDNVETKLDKIETEIVQEVIKVPDEKIEKVISNVDKNHKNHEISADDGQKSTESYVEQEKTKRGSMKNKSSSQLEDKKSPSPETTRNIVCGTNINVDTTKVIDKSSEEKNKTLSGDNVETKLDKIEPEIVQEVIKVPDEKIENVISNIEENQKSNQIGKDDGDKSTGKENTKRGSKKNKSSSQLEDKKSPSPDTTKTNVCINQINVDTTLVVDKSSEEKNKTLSGDKVETKLDKIETEIVQDIVEIPDEKIENVISNIEENHKNHEIYADDGQKSTESYVEKEKTKRRSKKNKSSSQLEDKKSPSPETTETNVCTTELNVDTTEVIDKNIEENNKAFSDDKLETKLVNIEPEIVQDIVEVPDEKIENVISNIEEHQKSNEICADDGEKSTECFVEKEKIKRGSKKNKLRSQVEDKKSPSPETTETNVCTTEINVDTTEVIDRNIEENNKPFSDDKVETKLVNIEPEIVQDIVEVPDEKIENVISNIEEHQKSNEICADDGEKSTECFVEKEKTKRGSKKNKLRSQVEDKKSPSPETTETNVCATEINVETTEVIDKSIKQNNKALSDDKVETKLDKIEPEIVQEVIKAPEKKIKKEISTVDKNLESNEISNDDGEKSTVKDKKKRGSKKNKSSSRLEDNKSPSPETTETNVCATEINVNTTEVIDKNIEENNKAFSDDKVETKLVNIEPEIVQDIVEVPDEKIENVISNIEENQKSNEMGKDDGDKSTGKEKTKRGSKKNKPSSQLEDKKSPSPETTETNVCATEINVETTEVIDKSIKQNNKAFSDNTVETKLVNMKPKIVQDIVEVPDEKIENVISNIEENQKSNEICADDGKKSTECFVETEKIKRGSKKNKLSSQVEDKKSPSPDITKTNVCVNQINDDTTLVVDKSSEENNKTLSGDKVETKLDKIETDIVQEVIKVPDEKIEKVISNIDENQKSNEICADDGKKSTECFVETEKIKRGSKKNKLSSQVEDKKSPSPDITKTNVCFNQINDDTTLVVDKSSEENNKTLSGDKVETKLDKIETDIVQEVIKVPDEKIEKVISNIDENHKSNEISSDDGQKSTERYVEKEKTKRERKKNKSSLRLEDKKSPSPETTETNVCATEINVETTEVIDKSIEENNKALSDDKVKTKLDKIEPEIVQEVIIVPDEKIENVISNIEENQKSNEIGKDDGDKSTGIEKTKRGSKKNKPSSRLEDKKSPSPEITETNVCATEINVETTKVIDKSGEENNTTLSNNKVECEFVKTELLIAPDNRKKSKEIIDQDASTDYRIEIQKNIEFGADDKMKLSNKDETKRKKDESCLRLQGRKSTSSDIKIINEKLEIDSEIEKKENTIPEITDDFTVQLHNGNSISDKMKYMHKMSSLENIKIDIVEKSKINVINTDLSTNTNKCVSDNPINYLRSNRKERKLTGMTEHGVVDVPEVGSLDKRPVNCFLLDVTDACKLRPNTLVNRSLTPEPLTSHRSLTPDYRSSYRSLTPESPSYKSSLTPRSKYSTPTRYAGSSDRELYGGYSSGHSSSRCTSPYPSESRISTQRLWPTNGAAYRCHSETSILLSPRRMEVETTSSWPYTSYGMATRKRRGSDSFLHDLGVRDGGYYSSWRLSDGRTATSLSEDLYRTKEAFKGLYFCVRMIDQTVSSGARVKFWCSVVGHPEPRVQWYRDGQKLNSFTYNSSARYQTKYDGGLAQLIVDNAQSGDSGEYTCVASNGRDRISTTGFLTVYTSPSVFRKPLLQPSLSVDGIESGRRLYSQTSHDFRFSVNDKFDFGCQKFSGGLTIRRPEYPKFVSSIIADDVATYGGTIALQVRVQGSPVPNVTWMRESRPLPRSSGKYIYLDEGGLYTLLVMDSTARDGGKYVCRACNLYGVADAEKAVRVVSPQDYTDRRGVKPAIIVSRPNDRLNVAVGEDITVTLRVAGEPKPKVIWMRGSRDVTFLDRSLKETVNDYVMLSIKKAKPSDAGTYFIIAKNVYGSDRAFVTVGVRKRARSLTPPQIRNTISRRFRPTGGVSGGRGGCANYEVPGPVLSKPAVTDRTNKRISLQWDRPEKPETVLVYRVETRSADEECWKQVGMTPTNTIDVYNLKPGYRYQFRVTARNRFGWSQPVASEEYVEVFEPKCLPEFHQPLPGETRVLLQHSATLQCHVRGVPEPQVRWFKDGEPLLASDRHVVGRTNAGKCTLTIADVADGDAGRYSCEAVNDQGRVCTLTVVQVIANRRIVEAERRLQGCLMKNNDFKESAPVFTKHLIDRRVDINSTVRLSCQVNGLPVPLVLWYKDGRPIDFASGTKGDRKPPVRDDSDDFYTLELTGVKYDDSGAYAAVASNAIGKASSRCVLEVFNKNRTDPAVPAFVFSLPPTIEAVDSIVLNAQIDAYRPAKVEWFRDGIKLRNGRRVDIITDHDGNLELRIACVTNRDSGTYMLRVSNDTGTVESRCEVNVVEREHKDMRMEQISLINHLYSKKPKFVVKPKFQEVEEGQEVIIDSEIVGDPLPKITWLRDGLKPEYYRDNSEFLCVSNGNRYQLKIPHAKLTHTGTYTLLAANPHGQIKALISLQVYSTGHCKKKMENGSNYATVERLPRVSRGLVDIECRENDNVSFECKLNITQETDIRWQKDGKLVRLGKQIKSQLVDGDTARLDISNASPLHEGLYTCTAFNELGQDSTSARLILFSDSEAIAKVPQSNGLRKTMLNSPILAGEANDRSAKRLKRSSAPKFYAVLHDRIADVGETVRFLCSVSGHPPPWSSWEKDGQPIGVNSRMRIREDDDHRSLEICDVTSEDAGLYRITVENKFGKIQATARLEVLTHNQATNDIQITTSSNGRRQSGSAACAGENFTLSCDIRGNSMSDVTWYKDDEKIKPDDRVTSSLDDLAARLSILNLESADTGVYTCVARCESGVTRCSTELCVFDTKPGTDSYLQPPIFVKGLVPKHTADEGEPVQLTVRLQGAVPMSASWFKNNVPVPDCADFEYVVDDDRSEFGLSITDPFVKDSGTYSCKVANTFGQAISSGQLIINEMSSEHQGPMVVELNNNLQDVEEKTTCDSTVATRTTLPASIISGPYDTTVLRGAKVVLKASYRGDPEPCVQWLRGGKVLESNAHLCITNECGVSSLTIDSITADDCGKYVVRVDNGHGNDFHFASVAVEGPPDPPAGRPVVCVSETSADVTWSSPAYDGGCMVTGYGVEVRPFNQSDWKLVADKCHSLSHIVRGLAPGESYVFRVRAENMHGSSEASLESTPVYILQTDYGNTLWPKTVNIENGEQFDKQYEVLDELGKGRYGVVYKVKERETNKFYAAKFVRCIKSTDKEKAQEEVDIMNCLRHPKLLQLDAAFDKPREVVLVTEYISGGELFERVVADDFTLTEKDCILFTRQICEGVDYMHKQNVVHLDLKPENIMCQSRTSHYVKLIDFGLAQKIIPGQPMRVLFGTPEFIPPEIIGYEPIGLESDMWSVGVICYVLLSGLSPFMGDNDSETFTNITKADFDFDDEAFDAVSQDAKDFISALLIKRKELRLTARECLKHKWLAQQDMDMSCVILSTDKLKKFIIRRKWQKTGNAIRALGRMATLSAASRRGVSGGGGTGSGCGTGSVLQKLKMASLREEESASEPQEIAITETTKIYSGRRSCDARSDSGFSDCPSVSSPIAMLVRPTECQSATSEDTPLVFDQDRCSPPPTRHSPSSTTRHSPPSTTRHSPSPPFTCRPSSPTTHRHSSHTTRGLSNPVTRGPSPLSTHLRSPLPRNRHDVSRPVHNIPLPTGTNASGVCKTNRMIFDNGRRDGNASSPGVSGGGAQRKEPIRIQTGDNFKKAVAFWKQ